MSSIDDIKKKLNIDEMDEETRKKMFNKFIEKGGKVIEEKAKKQQALIINREKQRLINEKLKQRQEELNRKYAQTRNRFNQTEISGKRIKHSIFTFMSGVINGYFSFSKKFNKKFSRLVIEELHNILSTLNYLTGLVINLETEKKIEAAELLNRNAPYTFELIMRAFDLNKVSSINRIQLYFQKYNNVLCPEIISDIKVLYKDMVIIYPYWESLKEAVWKGLLVVHQLIGKEPMVQKQKIYKFIDSIFSIFLPGFHYILIYNLGVKVPLEYQSMYTFVDVKPEEEFGCLTKQLLEEKKKFLEQKEKEKEEKKKVLEESVEKREMEKIPKHTQKGLQMIDNIIEKIPSLYKTDSELSIFEKNEKMLYFYTLFREFDKEYSFILTTSQIKITPRLESGKKIDIKGEFEELTIKQAEIVNFIKEYTALIEQKKSIEATFKNAPLAMQQKINVLNSKKMQTFNEIKGRSSLFFKKLENALQKLILDYQKDKLLLQNGDDLLHFELGEKKKIENVKIINAIAIVFSFASGFYYYLNFDKLSQKGLYIEEIKSEEKDEDVAKEIDKKGEIDKNTKEVDNE
ncbi:MAG TPA: hypothetical protein PLE45_05085 [Spirochaetota bacterium]|nr:hypothetical protein [Spirochaetota bacterium]HOL56679.1 hypothetical protein [Spirochaetota bacterium]HPP03315.1 hypothetical protein [Spirochaetota bacterium]